MRAFIKGFPGTPWSQFITNIDGTGRGRCFLRRVGKRYRHTAINVQTVIEGDGKRFLKGNGKEWYTAAHVWSVVKNDGVFISDGSRKGTRCTGGACLHENGICMYDGTAVVPRYPRYCI